MNNRDSLTLSDRIRHFFHVVSNVRPIYWILLYIGLVPVFALIYWALPDTQFRIPDNSGTDYGSWLYYSIVTISTLGFGDYTPMHGWAQAVTAVEVMCGLIVLGLFLNAVGSMKSEIDVASEVEKQRRLHLASEREKLVKTIPMLLHVLNRFLSYCYLVSTPIEKRSETGSFDPDFNIGQMRDMFEDEGLSGEKIHSPAVELFVKCADKTSLAIDSLPTHIDMTLWPELMEDCFSFVANTQVFDAADRLIAPLANGRKEAIVAKLASASEADRRELEGNAEFSAIVELYDYVKENGILAQKIQAQLVKNTTAN